MGLVPRPGEERPSGATALARLRKAVNGYEKIEKGCDTGTNHGFALADRIGARSLPVRWFHYRLRASRARWDKGAAKDYPSPSVVLSSAVGRSACLFLLCAALDTNYGLYRICRGHYQMLCWSNVQGYCGNRSHSILKGFESHSVTAKPYGSVPSPFQGQGVRVYRMQTGAAISLGPTTTTDAAAALIAHTGDRHSSGSGD